MSMTTKQLQQALRNIGWPLTVDGSYGPATRSAVKQFQRGYTFANLSDDGYAGPLTQSAVEHSLALGGLASSHFHFAEWKSHGNGWIELSRVLARALEKYRLLNGPTRIVSGYRDPVYNRSIGGASNSQHTYGTAADIDPRHSLATVRKLGVFSGIGVVRSSGLVTHVDVRGQWDAPATTPGTPGNPTIWFYNSDGSWS